MGAAVNRQLKLARRPEERVSLEDFTYEESAPPQAPDGAVLAKTMFLSVGPTNRVWMKDIPQYMPPVAIGEVMRSGGLAEVVQSNLEGYASGDLVFGMTGWQDYSVLRPGCALGLAKIPNGLRLAPEKFLGVCGPNGVTAYAGMIEVAQVGPGDTAIVTAAAGSVGSAAGQIAKLKGARESRLAAFAHYSRMVQLDQRRRQLRQEIALHLQRTPPSGYALSRDGAYVQDRPWQAEAEAALQMEVAALEDEVRRVQRFRPPAPPSPASAP